MRHQRKQFRVPHGDIVPADRAGLGLALGPPSSNGPRAETFRIGFDEYLVISFASSAEADVEANPNVSLLERLTNAEREVAGLVLGGLSNQAIARRRKVSLRTIVNQVSSIYRKLAVRSRRELSALRGRAAFEEQ